MSDVYEEDILNAGKDQVIIARDDIKVAIVPELGGRIADCQCGETQFLYRTYPEGVEFGPYTEYGGIEECIGGAPGSLWNAVWRWERVDDGVLLQALSQRTLVSKFISLDETEPIIKVDYDFLNLGNGFSKFTFGIHPEVCIGGSLKDNRYHVPTGGELLNGAYVEAGFKNKLQPSEGWCAITCEGKVFGQMFPEGMVDIIEVYYPRIDTHVLLEPIIFGVGLSPEKRAGFTYMLYMDDGDAQKVREIRNSRKHEFPVKYETFDRSEIPPDVMAELDETARVRAKGELADRLRQEAEDPFKPRFVRGLFERDLGTLTDMMGRIPRARPAFRQAEPEETRRTGDLPPGTEINIDHVKGNIAVNGWEMPYIEYTDMQGNALPPGRVTVDQREGVVRLNTTGDYSVEVPGFAPKIAMKFVNGDVAVSNVTSSLEITGVKGEISVISARVPDDGTLGLSLVTGNISLTIPGDSSCSISATSLSGEIACDLPLQDEERSRTQLSGALKDGNAKITLKTTRGDISILILDA
jgi:hypothetical protein